MFAAFPTVLFESLSALFHFLFALRFECLVFLALFVGQDMYHLGVALLEPRESPIFSVI